MSGRSCARCAVDSTCPAARGRPGFTGSDPALALPPALAPPPPAVAGVAPPPEPVGAGVPVPVAAGAWLAVAPPLGMSWHPASMGVEAEVLLSGEVRRTAWGPGGPGWRTPWLTVAGMRSAGQAAPA